MSSISTDLPYTAVPRRRIIWGAVFAGALVAMATYIALSTLGLAIGLATIDPNTSQQALQGLGTGAGIWMGLSSLLALFAGGIVAGRLAGAPHRLDAALHGLVTWAAVTIATLYLISASLVGLIGGVANLAGSETVAAQTEQLSPQALQQQAAGADQTQLQAVGQQAAQTGGTAALWSFIGLVLGAAAASAGGLVGKPKRFVEPPPPRDREPERVPIWEDVHA